MLLNRRPKIHKLARKQDSKRLIAALGYHDYVADRFDRLFDLGTSVRRDAALALSSAPDADDVDVGAALIAALGDTSGAVRSAAAQSLAARGEKRALSALATAALTWREPRDDAARSAATEALLALSGPDAAEAFVQSVIRHETDTTDAANILARMVKRGGEGTSRRASAAALAMLSIRDGAALDRAADVLVWLGPGSVDPLLSALTSDGRLPAISALGKLRDLRSSEALIGLLKDHDPQVRRAAAEALGEIADPRASSALVGATSDTDPGVRESALAAVRRVAPTGILQAAETEVITAVPVRGAVTEAGKTLVRQRPRSPSWFHRNS